MDAVEKRKSRPKEIIEDTSSGSLAYNRLEMQVSQAIHMAVEMHKELDYLLVLDHYDDISIFDKEDSPTVVSYYQLKSKEDLITIDSVVRKEWLPKLYLHLKNETWHVKELGLVTPCVLKVSASQKDGIKEQILSREKTPFAEIGFAMQRKIKEDIGEALSISADNVDLSRFVHMRTTLTIAEHRNIAEQNLNALLYKVYPHISLDTAKTIFNTLVELLSQKQRYEGLSKDSGYETVRKNKGVSKNDITRIINSAMMVSIPTFDEVEQWSGYQDSEAHELSLAYLQVVTDDQRKNSIQRTLFQKTDAFILANPLQDGENIVDYAKRVRCGIGNIPPIYSELYMLVVVTSVMINHWRRDNA